MPAAVSARSPEDYVGICRGAVIDDGLPVRDKTATYADQQVANWPSRIHLT